MPRVVRERDLKFFVCQNIIASLKPVFYTYAYTKKKKENSLWSKITFFSIFFPKYDMLIL